MTTDATGAAAARSISGNHPLHEQLEAELARLKSAEAALLFPPASQRTSARSRSSPREATQLLGRAEPRIDHRWDPALARHHPHLSPQRSRIARTPARGRYRRIPPPDRSRRRRVFDGRRPGTARPPNHHGPGAWAALMSMMPMAPACWALRARGRRALGHYRWHRCRHGHARQSPRGLRCLYRGVIYAA